MSVDLSEYLKNLLITEKDSDFTIIVFDEEGHRIERKAHKIILQRSPYFEGLFNVAGKEKQDGSVTFDNISNLTLSYILHYLYYEDLEVPVNHAADVILAAEYLQLQIFKEVCVEILRADHYNLSSDELAAALDKTVKHDLLKPTNDDRMWLSLLWNPGEWTNLSNLSLDFITTLVEYYGQQMPRQCIVWLDTWIGSDEFTEQKQIQAKQLIDKVHLLQLSAREILECSTSPLLEPNVILELLRKKAKDEDDGSAKRIQFELSGNGAREFEYEGYQWLFLFQPLSLTRKNYKRVPIFEYLYGEANVSIKTRIVFNKTETIVWEFADGDCAGFLEEIPFKKYEDMLADKSFVIDIEISRSK